MKYKLLLALLLTSFIKSYAGDLTTAVLNPDSGLRGILIPDGKVMEIVTQYGGCNYIPNETSVSLSGSNPLVYVSSTYKAGTQKFAGPGVLLYASGERAVVTYRLVDNISTTTTTPTSAVVIPTDATGQVKIVLESSTDLVNWTEANPGNYGASAYKRFFRVRAVNQ
jgi:hypothetical protein